MPLVTFDAETYYDREYSLTKLTTEEYVRDPRFELIGFSIKVDDAPTVWVPQEQAETFIREFDWSNAIVLAQNTAFDGAILSWRYGVNPKGWADTLGMSRALFPHARGHSLKVQAERMGVGIKGTEVENALGKHYADFTAEELARYAQYCVNDVDLTYSLFAQYVGMGFPKQELRLIDLTLRMFIQPTLVLDKPHLQDHLETVQAQKFILLMAVKSQLDLPDVTSIKKALMSGQKFADLLRAYGVEPPMKVSLTTGKPTYAFAKSDVAFQALEEHPDARVQSLVAARLGNKSTIEETRTQRFIEMADRGAFPVPLRYYGAHSGRWSGQDKVNLQNLPSRGPNAKQIKRAIRAPEGFVLVDCDSAQIEARVLAWLAGQTELVEAFENKEDVYKIMAEAIYAIPRDQITKQQRQVGKTVILGAGYGVGHMKLQLFLKTQAGVDVSEHEAKRIIDTYRSRNNCIQALWSSAEEALDSLTLGQTMTVDAQGIIKAVPGSGLTLPSGLYLQYPGLRKMYVADRKRDQWVYTSRGVPTYIYGGKIVENFTQAVARCAVAEQMLRISKRYRVVLTVHDSVVALIPKDEAQEGQAFVEQCMSWRPKWAQTLPLACESAMGDNYGDC